MRSFINLLIGFAFVACFCDVASAQQKTEAKPAALDRVEGSPGETAGPLKRHEKEIREKRNATPERGDSPHAKSKQTP